MCVKFTFLIHISHILLCTAEVCVHTYVHTYVGQRAACVDMWPHMSRHVTIPVRHV